MLASVVVDLESAINLVVPECCKGAVLTLDNDPALFDMDRHALGLFPQPLDVLAAMEEEE